MNNDPITKEDYRECLNFVINIIINNTCDINYVNSISGNDLLTLAFKINNNSLINWVLDNPKINVNNVYHNSKFNNALAYGIYNDNDDAVIKLINKGVNLDYTSVLPQPLNLAISKNKLKIVNCLIDRGAWKASPSCAERVLLPQIKINAKDNYGNTALTTAIKLNYIDMVKLLSAAGANVNTKNKYGDSPIKIAAERGYNPIVKFLVGAGANVNTTSKFNETALCYAIATLDLDLMEFLCKAGADPNIKPDSTIPLLMKIIWKFPLDDSELIIKAMKILIEGVELPPKVKININDIDKYGNNVLIYAVKSKCEVSVIEFICKAGVDISHIDNNGKNVFSYINSDTDPDVKAFFEKIINKNLSKNKN